MSINNSPLWNKGLQSSGDLMTDTLGQMTQQQSNFNPNALSANEPAQPTTPTAPDTTDVQQKQDTGPSPACQAAKQQLQQAQQKLQMAQFKHDERMKQAQADIKKTGLTPVGGSIDETAYGTYSAVKWAKQAVITAQHAVQNSCGGM